MRLLQEGLVAQGHLTLQFLLQLLSDAYTRHVILFTAEQALLSTLLAAAIGFPWAYIFARYDFPGKAILRSLTIIPFVLPSITVAVGFILFFGNNGALNRLLMSLFHLRAPPLRVLYSLWGIVLAHAFYNAPIITRMVSAAWERLDPSYEESAQALGAGQVRRFVEIVLPLLLPSLMTSMALAFIFCFLSFPIVLALGGARFSTIEVEIYTLVRVLLDYRHGAALAIIEIILSLGFTYGYILIEGRFTRELETARIKRPEPLFRPTIGRAVIFLFIFLSAIFFLGPILAVFYDSLTQQVANHVRFTFHWYKFIFRPEYEALIGTAPLRSIWNSLQFGLTAMGLAVVIGLPLSFIIARGRFTGRRVLDTLIMAPLGVSSVALGLALLRAFLRPPLQLSGTWLAIAIAQAILAYPFVIRAVVPVLEAIAQELIAAARGLGAGRLRAFLEIELPLIRRGLLVGAVFAFAISLGEMSATIMLATPQLKTMPLVINDLRATRSFGGASAMSVLLILVTAAAFVIIERFGERVFNDGQRERHER